MNSDHRTNPPGASSPHGKSTDAAAEATDLAALDAEANADIDRWPRPRAIFIGVGPNVPVGDRRAYATARTAPPAKSSFRRMIDSFFGLDARR